MERTANGRPVINEMGSVLPNLAVGDATLEQLQDRLQSTIRVENQAAAVRAETLAELTRRKGIHITEINLREKGLRPSRKARSEVETAVELEELPKTSEGLRDGEIPYENARILAKASQEGEIDETELVGKARTQSPDKFAATVRKYQQQRSEDDGMSRLEHQRSQRFAKIKTDRTDGMTVLYGRFDPITGALLETALSQKMNELWREEDPRARCSPGQKMADALAGLVTREDTGEDGKPPRGPRLLLIADYDVVSRELRNGRLGDGTPIPVEKIRDLACQSDILPAIFRGMSQPMDLGRSRRAASPAQRIALVARDKNCVGCGANANWCQAHHIIPWAVQGNTDLNDMCLLCSRCHHKVHDDRWQVRRKPSGQYYLKPPLKHDRPTSGRRNSNYRNRRSPFKQRK
ncbi:MAG: DUF222 domain-containing protein [bacterium]|nr:DUF222 domain-containing protein [bacterium]MDE0601594.1 DUF222 domain-containing protein [bacterium]